MLSEDNEDAPYAAIIIMCKAPVAGTVKTRLTPFLSGEQAADLASAFIHDTVLKFYYSDPYSAKIVAFAPADGKAALKRFLPRNLIWIEQHGALLGDRIHNALIAAFRKGYSPLMVIGTDSPTLPREFVNLAWNILVENQADVVLGPTEDGGFYLVGAQLPNSQIFADVEWSTEKTFEQTARNVNELNLRVEVLPVWYDVDEPEDLKRLFKEIEQSSEASEIAPATALWLRENAEIFNNS